MALPRFAWGIDVGNTALKAVRVAREGGQIRVTDFEVIEHDQILSNSGDNRQDLMKKTLAEFVQRRNIKGSAVAVSVSGQQSFARFIKLPPVEPKKIPEIVRFEAVQQIPFPLSDVEWSYQLFRDEQSPDVEVGIFAMRKELVNNYISYFTDVDLNVQVVQMNSLAVYNALYHDDRFQGTTMAIDMGAETTDLVIADGETVWLRSIPIGGNNFTESLVKSFKLNFAKAEELKRNAATSKYARQIFQAMRPVFADLANEIQRSMGFYASVHRDSRLERIVALGGTFKLPGLQKYLQQNLQLNIERLDGLSAGAPADPKQAAQFSDHLLSMVTAYGLGLQALGEGKISSSLLPASIQRAKLWKEKTKWFAATAAGFVLAPAIAYGALQLRNQVPYESSRAKDARGDVDSAKSAAEKLDRSWSEIQQSGQEDRTLVENVESLLKYRDFWPNLITDLYGALPKPQWDPTVIDPAEMKSTPRELRNLIVIESITPRFLADVAPLLAMSEDNFRKLAATYAGTQQTSSTASSNMGMGMGMQPGMAMPPGMGMPPGAYPPGAMPPGAGMPGMMPPGMMPPGAGMSQPAGGAEVPDNPNARRGFVVTITGTTPNQGGFGMIQKTIVEKLATLDIKSIGATRGYYIGRVSIGDARKFSVSPQRLQRVTQINQASAAAKAAAEGTAIPAGVNNFAGMGMPGTFTPSGNTGTNDTQQYLDPLTGENVLGDTEFTVYVVVVVDPSKADIEAAANATVAGQNNAPQPPAAH